MEVYLDDLEDVIIDLKNGLHKSNEWRYTLLFCSISLYLRIRDFKKQNKKKKKVLMMLI